MRYFPDKGSPRRTYIDAITLVPSFKLAILADRARKMKLFFPIFSFFFDRSFGDVWKMFDADFKIRRWDRGRTKLRGKETNLMETFKDI